MSIKFRKGNADNNSGRIGTIIRVALSCCSYVASRFDNVNLLENRSTVSSLTRSWKTGEILKYFTDLFVLHSQQSVSR